MKSVQRVLNCFCLRKKWPFPSSAGAAIRRGQDPRGPAHAHADGRPLRQDGRAEGASTFSHPLAHVPLPSPPFPHPKCTPIRTHTRARALRRPHRDHLVKTGAQRVHTPVYTLHLHTILCLHPSVHPTVHTALLGACAYIHTGDHFVKRCPSCWST